MAIKTTRIVTPTSRRLKDEFEAAKQYPKKVYNKTQRKELQDNGFIPLVSSNVSAVSFNKDFLYIRFHNGAVYKYNVKAPEKMFKNVSKAGSAGRWVHKQLKKKNVPYSKVGSMPLTRSKRPPKEVQIDDVEDFRDAKVELNRSTNKARKTFFYDLLPMRKDKTKVEVYVPEYLEAPKPIKPQVKRQEIVRGQLNTVAKIRNSIIRILTPKTK